MTLTKTQIEYLESVFRNVPYRRNGMGGASRRMASGLTSSGYLDRKTLKLTLKGLDALRLYHSRRGGDREKLEAVRLVMPARELLEKEEAAAADAKRKEQAERLADAIALDRAKRLARFRQIFADHNLGAFAEEMGEERLLGMCEQIVDAEMSS